MSTPKPSDAVNIALPGGGIRIKIENKDSRGLPYLKGDIFQISRIGDEFSLIVHQKNYQHIVNELVAGRTEIENDATIPVGKFVINQDGFIQLKEQIEEIYKKWQESLPIKQAN